MLAAFFAVLIVYKTDAVQRSVLIEIQTSTENETNCYETDCILNQLFQDYPDYFTPIVYHDGQNFPDDPFYCYNIPENTARVNYYPPHSDGYYYTPYAWIDGVVRGGFEYNMWEYMIINRHEIDSPLEIDLSGEFRESDRNGNLQIIITAHEAINWQELKLRIALTEDSIYYEALNNVLWHNHTMRDIIPDTLGVPFNISVNDTLEFNQSFSCPEPLNSQFCRLVVWVQDDQTQEILQSARITINQLTHVSVENDQVKPLIFAFINNYPNPFNSFTTIAYNLNHDSAVSLEIFDLNGRTIKSLINCFQSAGQHRFIWDGTDDNGKPVASGIYFYSLKTQDGSQAKRMLLLK